MKGFLDQRILPMTEVTLCFAGSPSLALASAVVGTADGIEVVQGSAAVPAPGADSFFSPLD